MNCSKSINLKMTGRPSDYSQSLADVICERLSVDIYEILDPRDGSVRYIGKANDSALRFKQHLRETRRKTPLYDWMQKMRSAGLVPTFRVSEVCPVGEWQKHEVAAIAAARLAGARLLNVADGGDEPHCSTEVRAENGRKVAVMRVKDPRAAFIFNAKRVLGTALKQGYVADKTKAKMRLAAAKHPALFGAWAAI